MRSRDFSFRGSGFLRLIINDGSLIHFSTFRKGRKRRKDLVVQSKNQRVDTKSDKETR
jgi:hypothetical protein